VRRNTNPIIPERGLTYLLPPAEIASTGRFLIFERFCLIAAGLGLVALLTVAGLLTPSPQGYGTHRQLGIPDCSWITFFGMRCPGCGMTTAWAHCMRGDLMSALHVNVGGAMLCLLSLGCAPMMIGLGITGRPTRGRWFFLASTTGFCIAMGVAILEWLIRLAVSG
jgi:hypothetical protein